MSNELLQKLERKIQHAVETIELLQLQIEELAERNASLAQVNKDLQAKQTGWEKTLHSMLDKLNTVAGAEQSLANIKSHVAVDAD